MSLVNAANADSRKMCKVDVNKTGRIFDFLVSSGVLILSYDPTVKHAPPPLKEPGMFANGDHYANGGGHAHSGPFGQLVGNGANGH